MLLTLLSHYQIVENSCSNADVKLILFFNGYRASLLLLHFVVEFNALKLYQVSEGGRYLCGKCCYVYGINLMAYNF